VSKLLSPGYSLLRAASVTFKNCEGPVNTVVRAFRLFQREGLGGIWRGVKIVIRSGSTSDNYPLWVKRYDTMTAATRKKLGSRVDALPTQPLISVVVPTYNARPEWLAAAIDSVREQIYPNWELCIADDASTKPEIKPLLQKYAMKDSRIKVVFREKNGHISAASNSALAVATGDWIALLDHDDLLPEHALYWVAQAIVDHPDVRIIYSDEDKIDDNGKRHSHYFKCDFNADLFYSHNMISHLGVYQAALLQEVGGFRLGMEGSQDHDLALRCIEHIRPDQVHHIPRVLYHWRSHSESTAHSPGAKPYAAVSGERALNEHFARTFVDAVAEYNGDGYRVHYSVPTPPPLVSIVIPTRNGHTVLRKCVDSILERTDYRNYEIVIVDNGSDQSESRSYLDQLQKMSNIHLVREDRPFNYSALNNLGARAASGEILALLNNDLEVISPEWLSEMVSLAVQPGVGAVGARLWYPNGSMQHAGVILGLGGVAGHGHKFIENCHGYCGRAQLIQSLSAVTAACLVVRKTVFEEVGGFDEARLKIDFNDVDFCLRIREAGYRNVYTPFAELYHHESVSRGKIDTPMKKAQFDSEVSYMKERWGDLLENDPAYSPNLTLADEDFGLAFPPRVEQVGVVQDRASV
jgi:O-antigen biosynthesis protein